jgi:hypothetical protein
MESGRGWWRCLRRVGLWSKDSSWEKPPLMKRQMTRLARGGK